MSRRFRPGWVPTVVALVSVAILASLGSWQVRRHYWRGEDIAAKNARIDLPPLSLAELQTDPEGAAYRRVVVEGTYDPAQSILVTRVPRGIREGVRILTPLRADGLPAEAPALMVDRGWAPYNEARRLLEGTDRAQHFVVTGLYFPLAEARARPGSTEQRRQEWVRFNPLQVGHVSALQAQLPYALSPILIQRDGAAQGDGEPLALPIGEFSRPTSPVDHIAYAMTWFGLALAAAGTWLGLGFSQGRSRR